MFQSLILVLLALAARLALAQSKAVFTHVIVGNTYSYTQDNWASDIKAAAAAGIDGFALNIASQDTANGQVQNQLNNVFNAADSAGFKLFFSFDYAAQGAFDQGTVINTLNAYTGRGSYFKYTDGKPLASTFEGPGNAGDWGNVKSQTNAFFMPDYSSQGPAGAAGEPNIDGIFSWEAWPNGANDISDNPDQQYVSALAGRPYMMPVSPWFYTNLPQYNKNWLWRGDSTWHERWQQVLAINPSLVEIISWNDYGESHYIGPLPPTESAIPSGAEWYVDNMPHNAWLNDLPYYIAQYKGQSLPTQNHITTWYRLNPGTACDAAGTTCNTASQGQTETSPQACDTDQVFFTAFVPAGSTATVSVQIGSNAPTTVTASAPGIFHSSVPFNGQTGAVTISASGSGGEKLGPVACPVISTDCSGTGGRTKWNAWVGGS